MSKQTIEKKVVLCKKCDKSTIHIKNVKRMTAGGIFGNLILIVLTGGLWIFIMALGLLFNKKGKWVCERCMH